MKFLSRLVEIKILVNWGMVHCSAYHLISATVTLYRLAFNDIRSYILESFEINGLKVYPNQKGVKF